MKYPLLLFCFTICLLTRAQLDTMKSIYKNLPVMQFYSISTETITENGNVVYKAGGKAVDKATYDKYNDSHRSMMKCKPCILETYDGNNILASRAVKYLDCPVGYWINYYPDGKIRTIGHYRQNESDVWEPLWDAGYCMKHGLWTDYDQNGKVIKTELYDFGNLKENKK
jgi:antitoxin component YwqK of YwqJK toxin-antitoxin module